MIIGIGFEKGGVGKTTLTVELALAALYDGLNAVVVDTDPQRSATYFRHFRAFKKRNGAYPDALKDVPVIGGATARLSDQLTALDGQYDLVLVDIPGRIGGELLNAIAVCDYLLIPVMPSAYEVWPLEKMNDVVTQAMTKNPKLQALVVPMRIDTGKVETSLRSLRDLLTGAQCGALTMIKSFVCHRRAFPECHTMGLSVGEVADRDLMATREILSVYKETVLGLEPKSLPHQRHQMAEPRRLSQEDVRRKVVGEV